MEARELEANTKRKLTQQEELKAVHVVDAARESVGDDERRRHDHCHAGLTLDVFDVEVEIGDHVRPAGLARRPERRKRLRLEVVQRLVVGHHRRTWRRTRGLEVKRAPGLEDAEITMARSSCSWVAGQRGSAGCIFLER